MAKCKSSDGMRSVSVEIYNDSQTRINPATDETVSQLVMAISKPINQTAYDLNAAAFSETTAITNDFTLDNLEMNFTTTSSRNITVTTNDGTVIFRDSNNIDTSLLVNFNNIGFASGENLTVDITQTGTACSADVILRIKSGSSTLVGNPTVKVSDSNGNIYEDAIVSHSMPVVEIDHYFTHAGATFTNSDTATVTAATSKYFLIITHASNAAHLITYHFTSTQANAEVVIYGPDSTVSDNGTSLTLRNKNGNSAKTPDTAFYRDPTITGSGTQMAHDLIVGGKQSGGSDFRESGEEEVLSIGSKYIIEYKNNSNQDDIIDWRITFLEPAKI